MNNNQFGRSILTNPFLARIVQMRRYFLTTCTKPLHKEKNIKQMSCSNQEKGRSMVEMLGVLAIIGVLSVGAIAGYQKAMMKYKLNKQTEQLSQLLNSLYRHRASWGRRPAIMNLIPYFIKLNEIPQEMIKANDDTHVYDSFNSKIDINTNGCTNNVCSEVLLSYYINENNSFELCQNVMNIGKALRDNLMYVNVSKNVENSTSDSYGERYYGNPDCISNQKCLKNLTNEDIYNQCQFCADKKDRCLFNFVYGI